MNNINTLLVNNINKTSMKTNNIILRPMGCFKVAQRTKDGMFNATDLLKQWNLTNNSEIRNLDNFWKTTNLPILMSEIAENELGFKSVDFTHLKSILSKTQKGKYHGGTWMHPVLFVKFAMYLSPKFEYHVLKFVSDQMLKFRNDAGDAYRKMANSVQKIVATSFMPIAMSNISKAINHVVFGTHETMMRNKVGEESKQQELFALEVKLAELIDDGFIKTYDELINYLRKKWSEKYTPSLLK